MTGPPTDYDFRMQSSTPSEEEPVEEEPAVKTVETCDTIYGMVTRQGEVNS